METKFKEYDRKSKYPFFCVGMDGVIGVAAGSTAVHRL